MKNFVQEGDNITLTAPYAVAAGAGFQVGGLFAVAANAAASGAEVVGVTEGVFILPKATGSAWTPGQIIYWDNSAKNCTTTTGSNLKMGHATEAAGSSADSGVVRLNGAY